MDRGVSDMPAASFQCGPSGGPINADNIIQWSDDLPDEGVRITALNMTYGDLDTGYLNTLQTLYSDGTKSETHGTTIGPFTSNIELRPGEYITEISGRYGDNPNELTIKTNLQTFGQVFTSGGAQPFRYQVPDGYEVVGFIGSANTEIKSIGIIMRARAMDEG
jgi:hypothetical protein